MSNNGGSNPSGRAMFIRWEDVLQASVLVGGVALLLALAAGLGHVIGVAMDKIFHRDTDETQ